MAQILKDMGITEYEPRVINQMLEFAYSKLLLCLFTSCLECPHTENIYSKYFICLPTTLLSSKWEARNVLGAFISRNSKGDWKTAQNALLTSLAFVSYQDTWRPSWKTPKFIPATRRSRTLMPMTWGWPSSAGQTSRSPLLPPETYVTRPSERRGSLGEGEGSCCFYYGIIPEPGPKRWAPCPIENPTFNFSTGKGRGNKHTHKRGKVGDGKGSAE